MDPTYLRLKGSSNTADAIVHSTLKIEMLPVEMILKIISKLNGIKLIHVSLTNKSIKRLAEDNSLWKRIVFWKEFKGLLGFKALSEDFHIKSFMSPIFSQFIISNNHFVRQFKNFLAQLAVGKNGIFTCSTFGKDKKTCDIRVAISVQKKETKEQIKLIENLQQLKLTQLDQMSQILLNSLQFVPLHGRDHIVTMGKNINKILSLQLEQGCKFIHAIKEKCA